VQWSTLWLTERKENGGGKQLRLAAAGGEAKKLLTAEDGKPAVYDFGEGLTGETTSAKGSRAKSPSSRKPATSRTTMNSSSTSTPGNTIA